MASLSTSSIASTNSGAQNPNCLSYSQRTVPAIDSKVMPFSVSSIIETDFESSSSKETKIKADRCEEALIFSELTQGRENLFKPFELMLVGLEKTLKEGENGDIHYLRRLVIKSLKLLEADIYPESEHLPPNQYKLKKIALLNEVVNRIFKYFADDIDVEEFARIAFLFSIRSLKYYYDYFWLKEERGILFKEIIDFFMDTAAFLATSKSQFTPKSVAKLIYTLSSLNINHNLSYRNNIILGLLGKAELLFWQNKFFTRRQAFLIMDGISRLYVTVSAPSAISKRSMFLTALTKKALPLLLTLVQPLKLFSSNRLILFRITNIKKLLSPPFDYSNSANMGLYFGVLNMLLENKKSTNEEDAWVSEDEVFDLMPPQLFCNRELYQKFDQKQSEIWSTDNEAMAEEDVYPNRYHLMYLAKQIRIIYEESNPRGVAWLIKKFADNILQDLLGKEKFELENMPGIGMNFHPEDIKDFLKVIRKCAFHMVILDIVPTIAKLCKQAFNPVNFQLIDSDLAIELLWINMVFSVLIDGSALAFTTEQQRRLFKVIGDVKNEDQARELFEIRALKWNGGEPFTVELAESMEKLFTRFAKSSYPSYEEKQSFLIINSFLYPDQNKNLFHDYICEQTGMEIDIAYISPRYRVAVHIDGPCHSHESFKLPTLKTLFRNKCLELAGWRSFNIDITISRAKTVELLQEVIDYLREDTQLKKYSDQSWKQDILFVRLFDDKPKAEDLSRALPILTTRSCAPIQVQHVRLVQTYFAEIVSASSRAAVATNKDSKRRFSSRFFHDTKEHEDSKRVPTNNRSRLARRGSKPVNVIRRPAAHSQNQAVLASAAGTPLAVSNRIGVKKT